MTMGLLATLAGGTGRLVGEGGRWKEGIFTHFSFRGGVAIQKKVCDSFQNAVKLEMRCIC